jgi:hypothetical protein
VVYKQRAASGICRPMQVYREKRRACAALKPGEKTLRVETSKGSVYKNLTDKEAIEEMGRATVHEVGNTNSMKVWFDFDKISDAQEDHGEEEKRLCSEMAKLAFVAYAAAGGWGEKCLLNLSETVLESAGEPTEINRCYACECEQCPNISLPEVDVYTSSRYEVRDGKRIRKTSMHAVASGDRCPVGPRMCAIAIIGTMQLLQLTNACVYVLADGQKRLALDVVPFTSKSLRTFGSEKLGKVGSRKILSASYRNGVPLERLDTDVTALSLRRSYVFDPDVPAWSTPQLHPTVHEAFSKFVTDMYDAGIKIPNLPSDVIYDKTDSNVVHKKIQKRSRSVNGKTRVDDGKRAWRMKVLKTLVKRSNLGFPSDFKLTSLTTRTRDPGYGHRETRTTYAVTTNIQKCPLRGGGSHNSNKTSIVAIPHGKYGDRPDVHVSLHCGSVNHTKEKYPPILLDNREWGVPI